MGNSKVDISVIVPIYGVEKYVEKALRSLFNQTKSDGVEFILVNDCTKDRSMDIAREVIAEYSNLDIIVIEHEVNGGIAVARQSAMDIARGEYFISYDSDDWCEPTMLEDMFETAKRENADVVVCDFYLSTTVEERLISQSCSSNPEECLASVLSNSVHGSLCTKIFRRSIITENNLEFVSGLDMGEDLLFCSKILIHSNSVCYLPKAYYHYVQHQSSTTAQLSNKHYESLASIIAIIEDLLKLRGKYDRLKEAILASRIELKFFMLYFSYFENQRYFSKFFPEISSRDIMNHKGRPKYQRHIMRMAFKGFLLPFNTMRRVAMLRDSNKKQSRF